MDILTLGNDLLLQKAAPVKDLKDKAQQWGETAQQMIDMMKKGKGIGLAGPQIGLMRRIFVTNIEGDVPRVFINPSIIETSQETCKFEEGCLSVPGVWVDVIRPKTVKVQAWNEKGRAFTLEAGGILARVILHEYDHLEGVLFINRLPEEKRAKILDKIAKKAAGGKKAERQASGDEGPA
ncbi:MAG: peptide deformylase [Treponema sp.]|jgi:peptide deformylase|nr:peptide deformylase [Treponema sp.]